MLKEAQPYASIEGGLTVGPSAICGLGLFTTRAFEAGAVVGYYTGEMVKCASGNTSDYIIEAKWWNKKTQKHDK